MASEAKRRANARYDADHTVQVKVKLNLKTDADILQRLSEVPNKQGYIKELIRQDKWTPCSERLPEEYGEYLVTAMYESEPYVTTDDYFSYGWDDWGDDVIAWREKPKPYKDGE